jgi:hypothetical protein
MHALSVFAECTARGITLTPRGDRLGVAGPRAAISEFRDRIIVAKPDLLALLSADTSAGGCAHCGCKAVWRTAQDGSTWCRRCDHRRALLDLAAQAGYPRLDLRPTMLFIVPGQMGGWVEFVRNVAATVYVARRRLREQLGVLSDEVIPSDSPILPRQD